MYLKSIESARKKILDTLYFNVASKHPVPVYRQSEPIRTKHVAQSKICNE